MNTKLVLILLSALGLQLSASAAPTPPNILLIMVDDMGYSDIGCYGGEVRTPTLDALAAGGVRLARFYNCAQCCPSRASLMSGLYPHQAGVGDMNEQGVANELWRRIGSAAYLGFKKEGVVTLPEALREAGYQTFMAGKWHLGQDESCWPGQRGFDRHFALIGGACEQFTGYRSWQKKGPITKFVLNGKMVEELPPDFYTTDSFTDHTLRFIEESDTARPWFGYLAYTAPHWPLQAHESDVAKYAETYRAGPDAIRQRRFERLKQLGLVPESAPLPQLDAEITDEARNAKKERNEQWMRNYAAMIDRVDQNLARIVEALRKRGQFDNTLILFLSDNGSDEVRGPLWGQVSNTPFRKFKVWVHDGGIASPFIAHWPAGIQASQRGKIVTGPAHIMDVFPTCLAAASAKHPTAFAGHAVQPLEGTSLLPALRGEVATLPMDRPLFWERMGNEAVRQGHWKLVRGYGPAAENGGIATTGPRTGTWELYDTTTDPGETRNLAAQQVEKLTSLVSQHEAWAKRVGVVPREEIVKHMQSNDLRVYHIGNSLTRNLPLDRLKALFASVGTTYSYGQQLGPGFRLEMHLVNANPGTPIAKIGRYNLVEPYSQYSDAFKKFTFDAVVLQPFQMPLDLEAKTEKPPFFTLGDFQAASALMDYARGKTKPGKGRWDLEHPNTGHVACERFYIYATWPGADSVLAHQPPTFASYYAQPYKDGKVSCADFYTQLVNRLNQRHADLPVPVRMIPAGEVMAVLDEKIRSGALPGIAEFYARNQPYFIKARRNNPKKSPFDPDAFDPQAGVLNFYADGIHLNDQPHNGEDSGTIGSYVAALTVFATLSGKSPVGLTVAPYEQFDAKADAALIEALQQTVWSVVAGHPHSSVKKP